MNVSGKMLLVLLTFIETDRPEFSLKHFACKGGQSLTLLRGNLLACKQGLRKLQIPFSVHPLTLVKLSEVILQQRAY